MKGQHMKILYDDQDILVAIKPPTVVSEHTEGQDGFADQIAARTPNGYVGVIHRLDRGVGGVMVYAKTPQAAKELSRQVQDHSFQKEYWAVIHNRPEQSTDTLRDLLFHDRLKNKTFVVDRKRQGVKEAILEYRVQSETVHPELGALSLLAVRLHTGRTHQIRVQFASRGMPLLGDGKYGSRDRCDIALFCHELVFRHPKTKKELSFSEDPCGFPWELFKKID